ncbi:MAG: four helix bundle protein [Candidatus Marinimicrobia bacterium]|nr:four helix bundle protein [Candidatus Neomarinimicrobiota bacterium]
MSYNIKEPLGKYTSKLDNRLFTFSINVIKMLRSLPQNPESKVIHYQLIKSVSSTGANYEESQAASSKLDFRNKIYISLKEMRETNYWLRIIRELELLKHVQISPLIDESIELMRILGSITAKLDGKRKDG